MSHLAIFYSLYNIIAIFAYITSSLQWRQGLNPRPLGCESFALTTKPWFVALFKNCGGEYEVNTKVANISCLFIAFFVNLLKGQEVNTNRIEAVKAKGFINYDEGRGRYKAK